MKKINLGYFGTRGLGNYGGFETIAFNISKNITDDFLFYVSKETENNVKKYEIEKINNNVFIINQKKTWLKVLSSHVSNMYNEGKIINDFNSKKLNTKIDVIFQCGSTPGLNIKKRKNNFLLLWNPDGMEWRRQKFPWYGKMILYFATKRGINLSEAVTIDNKALYSELKNILKNKPIYYLPSGANIIKEEDTDKSILKSYEIEKNEYYIIVGRAVPENHILEIVSYFVKAKTSKKLLVVANFGQDKYSKKVLKIIKDNSSKVIYKGPIYDQRILSTIRFYSYAYFHGHSVGGTNPSLLEALGAGNPSLCYDVDFNREVASESAFYFDNEKTFLEAVDKFESSIEIRNKMSEKAKEIVKNNFSWDYIVELHEVISMHVLALYDKIEKEKYFEWLKTKKYYDRFIKKNFDNFDKGIIK